MCSLVHIGKMVSARETIGRTNTGERLFSLAFSSLPRARSFSFLNQKGPLRKREKNALNSNSSVREFFLESIIINIFCYRNFEISWKCRFSPKNYFRWVTNCEFSITSIDVIQLVLTLEITTAQVVQTSVTFNNNSPIQDYLPRGGGGGLRI